MFYYLVEKIGDGTRENPFRPDINGAYVWEPNAVCPDCETYIVATDTTNLLAKPVTDLEVACFARKLPLEHVKKWVVGEE